MTRAKFTPYSLEFKRPSGTSRGVLKTKSTYFLELYREQSYGIGECNLFRGLSVDDRPDFEAKLNWVCNNIHIGLDELLDACREFPSIQFALEQAFLSLNASNPYLLFENDFSAKEGGISINGLVWMGDEVFMKDQIQEKLAKGFDTIKMKVGAIDFEREFHLLESIRKEFSDEEIVLRVDANGAFNPKDAYLKLKRLSELSIHSIEQPIQQGQINEMADLCQNPPIDIALDEELIGVFDRPSKEELLKRIKPQYIILKPALVGGFRGSEEWMHIADELGISYWITSALESNIGLNAIAQWTANLNLKGAQGLGTGSLFTNNIPSPLEVDTGKLYYRKNKNWKYNI